MMSGRGQYFSCNSVSLQTLGHVQEPSNAAHLKLAGHFLTLICTYFNLLGSNITNYHGLVVALEIRLYNFFTKAII